MGKGVPRLPDIQTLMGMGFDPKQCDKLLKYLDGCQFDRVDAIKRILRKNDRQQFVNRYCWDNLPNDLSGGFIERVLYYRYTGIFFYVEKLGKFNFLPFVGKGLDDKGRYTECSPLPFNGKSEAEQIREKVVYIPGLKFTPVYDITQTEAYNVSTYDGKDFKIDTINPAEGCVILQSYVKEYSMIAQPEQQLIDPLLDMMAEAMPLARTNLFAHAGATGMRVDNQDEESNVKAANKSLEAAALNGERFIPIIGYKDFQDLSEKSGSADGNPFFMYMQTLDNLRLQSYGLKNNGIFEKNEYINNTMAGNIQANVGQIYNDGLKLRQNFCDMVNAIWGLGISCSASETVTNSDTNYDGETSDDNPSQEHAGEGVI